MNMDYIELSYYPFHDIITCHDVLFPNGILYLKTLYLGSPDHVAEGEKWKLFGPGHFHFFTPETLQDMVRLAGFEIVTTKITQLITILARKTDRPGD